MSMRDRLLSKLLVDLATPTYDDAPCWTFTGGKSGGYGRFSVAGRTRWAHIVAYELWFGPVPASYELDHLCHTADLDCLGGTGCPHRACCNPAHLEAVTHRTNIARGRSKFARALATNVCINGHPFTPENTGRQRSGTRFCITCNRIRANRKKTVRPSA